LTATNAWDTVEFTALFVVEPAETGVMLYLPIILKP